MYTIYTSIVYMYKKNQFFSGTCVNFSAFSNKLSLDMKKSRFKNIFLVILVQTAPKKSEKKSKKKKQPQQVLDLQKCTSCQCVYGGNMCVFLLGPYIRYMNIWGYKCVFFWSVRYFYLWIIFIFFSLANVWKYKKRLNISLFLFSLPQIHSQLIIPTTRTFRWNSIFMFYVFFFSRNGQKNEQTADYGLGNTKIVFVFFQIPLSFTIFNIGHQT